jgi:hypothetical protein
VHFAFTDSDNITRKSCSSSTADRNYTIISKNGNVEFELCLVDTTIDAPRGWLPFPVRLDAEGFA